MTTPTTPPTPRPYTALVVTASNRASAGVYADRGGPLIAEALNGLGFTVEGPQVVPDGDPVEQALRAGVAAAYDVIVTTGGTGISPTDRTPTRPCASSTARSRASRRRSAPRAGQGPDRRTLTGRRRAGPARPSSSTSPARPAASATDSPYSNGCWCMPWTRSGAATTPDPPGA